MKISNDSLHLSSLNLSFSYLSFKKWYTSSFSSFTFLNHTIWCSLPESSFSFLFFLCFYSSLNFSFPAKSKFLYSNIFWSGLSLLSVGGIYLISPWCKWLSWIVYRLKQYWSGIGKWLFVQMVFSFPCLSFELIDLFQNPDIELYWASFLKILPSTENSLLPQDF